MFPQKVQVWSFGGIPYNIPYIPFSNIATWATHPCGWILVSRYRHRLDSGRSSLRIGYTPAIISGASCFPIIMFPCKKRPLPLPCVIFRGNTVTHRIVQSSGASANGAAQRGTSPGSRRRGFGTHPSLGRKQMRCWEHGSFQSRLLVDAMLTRLSQLQFELNGDQQTEQENIQMETDPITLGDFTGFYNWFYTTATTHQQSII